VGAITRQRNAKEKEPRMNTNEHELDHKFGMRSGRFRTPHLPLRILFVSIRVYSWFLLILCALLMNPASQAQDLAAKGRDVFKKERECIVTIQVVVKSKMGFRSGEGRERFVIVRLHPVPEGDAESEKSG